MDRAVFHLGLVDLAVDRTGAQEFGVVAGGDDLAVVEDQDLVGVQNRADPLGDDEPGLAMLSLGEASLNSRLGFHVDRAGAVVEDQHGWIDEHGAGDRDALLLATGEVHAALTDDGVVAVRKAIDEVVGLSDSGRLAHLGVAGGRSSVANVVANRAAEEHCLLQGNADVRAEDALVQVAHVDAVDCSPSPPWRRRIGESG